MIESALERLDAKRAQARRPYYLSLLAETYALAGHKDRALSILDAAIAMAHARTDVWWLPALYLQKGELEPAGRREETWRQRVWTRRGPSRAGAWSSGFLRTLSRTLTERSAS